MEKEISSADYKRFSEFEEKLLNLKDCGIVYRKEDSLEIEIRKQSLFSHFGIEKTNQIMEKLGLNFEDLNNHGIFIEIYKFLDHK